MDIRTTIYGVTMFIAWNGVEGERRVRYKKEEGRKEGMNGKRK